MNSCELHEDWIVPDWPAPPGVRALSTTRAGGFSSGPWKSLNLGMYGGDDPALVRRNRDRLGRCLPGEPRWLKQVHGVTVSRHPVESPTGAGDTEPVADAQTAGSPGQVCVVLTADCLPVLLCNRSGTKVAAAHAGWRGLAAGVLEQAVQALEEPPGELLAWLGPAIGPDAYSVGDEVRESFVHADGAAAGAFVRKGQGWLADLYALARQRLEGEGVVDISGGGHCTFAESERFFSYRRDGKTGRMASLVWLQP